MKKIFIFFLSAMLLAGVAFAETDLTGMPVASGNVTAAKTMDLVAPWSGTLKPFDLSVGDKVASGEALFEMCVTTVYAPEDGKVTAVFAEAGDDASSVMARYGALVSMEGGNPQRIMARNSGATGDWKVIQVGQPVWFRSDRTGRERGSGRVFMVSDSGYAVEVLNGSFELGETLNLYAEEALKNRVGVGTVSRRAPLNIAGMGRVCEVLVHEGDEVSKNQPLLTLCGADADPESLNPGICFDGSGVIAAIAVQPGQQVWKGALLARIAVTDRLEIIADVDEMDLARITIGTVCPVVLDMKPDKQVEATVTEISGVGVTVQNAAYYRVHLSVEETDLPLGASCSVYLPKE